MKLMKSKRINTLKDVRDWKELKREEVELEKMRLRANSFEIKSSILKPVSKFMLFETAIIIGKKTLFSLGKTLFKSLFSSNKKIKS